MCLDIINKKYDIQQKYKKYKVKKNTKNMN